MTARRISKKRWLVRVASSTAFAALTLSGIGACMLYAPLPDAPLEPLANRLIDVAGRQRSYRIYAPPGTGEDSPLMIALHSSQSSGGKFRQEIGRSLERLARHEKFVVAYPDGFEGHFNDCRLAASFSAHTLNIDDVAFIRAMIGEISGSRQANVRHVYALGLSNGGHMAQRLAWEASDVIDGIVSVAASLSEPQSVSCDPSKAAPIRVAFVAGTDDPINPYEGGRVSLFGFAYRGRVYSARDGARRLAHVYAAPSVAPPSPPASTVSIQTWRGPVGAVQLYTIEGGGHTLPQSDFRYPRLLGATLQDDAVLASAWSFLTEPGP